MDNEIACSCEHEHNNEHKHEIESGCSCEHEHNHEHSHEKKAGKSEIILFCIAALFFFMALIPALNNVNIIFYTAAALIGGYDLFLNGFKELISFKLEENSLLLIAVIASFILGEFPEACVVTLLFKLGSFLEGNAIAHSKKSMESLTKIRPDFAYIKNENGEIIPIKAQDVNIGDTVYLRAGDKVALDCEVENGNSSIDSSALTGEAIPVFVSKGDMLMSGSINLSGLLSCKVIKTFENSTASQIIDLVYESSKKKGKAENFISRIAKVYTPIVVVLAIIIAIVPPLLNLGEFSDFIMRALIFLVAACPCSLVISIPLAFFCAIGASSKLGVLVKGSMYVEKLAQIDTVCLDKTGTITSGNLTVDEVFSVSDYTKEDILQLTASIEAGSTHPIALSIVSYANASNLFAMQETHEIAGLGIASLYNQKQYLCGGKGLLDANKINSDKLPSASVYLCENATVIGFITIKEDIPPDSLSLVHDLKKIGIKQTIMLTGDNTKNAEIVAKKCGIDNFFAELLPKGKVLQVEALKQQGSKVLFVGDGINDAPVLAAADISASMGLGSSIANASSDIILASNKLSSLAKAISLSKRSMSIVYFNILFALIVKLIVLTLGATGFGTMWLAVFADIGVTILSVINAIRISSFVKKSV